MRSNSLLLFILFMLTSFLSFGQRTVDGLTFSSSLRTEETPSDFYRGKFLVLDFWATWCGPCLGSLPRFEKLEERFGNNDSVVFATITREPKEKIVAFLQRREHIPLSKFPLIDDNNKSWLYFGIDRIPRTIVFAPSGEIVFDGHPDNLSEEALQILLSGNALQPVVQQKQQVSVIMEPDWWEISRQSIYFAQTYLVDSSEEQSYSFAIDGEKCHFLAENYSLGDCIGLISDLPATRIRSNSQAMYGEHMLLHARFSCEHFEDRTKGPLPHQYQNHLLYILEKNYGFSTYLKDQRIRVIELEILREDTLTANLTISESGTAASWRDNFLILTGYTLEQLALEIEKAGLTEFPIEVKGQRTKKNTTSRSTLQT